jgi:competence protein ComEC
MRVLPLSFRRAPLLFAALCFAAGEALTRMPSQPPRLTALLLLGNLALVGLTLLALRRTARVVVLALGALWVGIGLWSAQLEPATAPQTAFLTYADGISRTVEGRVTRVRELAAAARNNDSDDGVGGSEDDDSGAGTSPALSVDMDVTAIEVITPDVSRIVPMRGGVRMTVSTADEAALKCGEGLRVPMRLRVPERYRDPGAWQYADYLLDQGIAATAYVPPGKLERMPGRSGSSLKCRVYAAQSWAAGRLLSFTGSAANRGLPKLLRLSAENAGMLNAMLFGDRTRLDHGLRLGFERTGSFHLFVVSGLHVALLAGMLLWAAQALGASEWLACAATLALTSGYALLTGFGVPVQRALAMTAVFLITRLLSRERNSLNALGAAALAVLVWSPRALFDASFQMTFLAVVAIAGIAVPLGERSFLPYLRATRGLHESWRDAAMMPGIAQFRVMLRFWMEVLPWRAGRALPGTIRMALRAVEVVAISVVAEAVMVLPMAFYFHRVTVLALPANIFAIPFIGVLLPLGIATFAGSLLSPWVAALPGAALAGLLHGLTSVVGALAHASLADLRTPGPTVAAALAACACLVFCCWAVRRSRGAGWLASAALLVAAAFALWPTGTTASRGMLEVTAIDVGQGDSLLVLSPAGKAMLIDAGGPTGAAANAENATGTPVFDVGEEIVSPYLWSRRIRRLDIVVLTHAHSDHMGGMAAVLRNFRPRELWIGAEPRSAAFADLLTEAAMLGIPIREMRAGDRVQWDGVAMTALAPAANYSNSGAPANDDSLVLRLQYGRASALLEGDAEAPSERAMVSSALAAGPPLGPNTLLKVGHHGSRTSTTPQFLELAAPADAVISVGRGNSFGHPRPEVIDRLAAAHAHVFRTDRFGLTSFLLSAGGGISATADASNP